MVCSARNLWVGLLVVSIALFQAVVTFGASSGAAQLEDVCKSRCQAMAEEYKKEKGAPLPPAALNECVDSCMHPPQIKSEADIPNFCRSRCERLLKTMNPGANAAGIKQCTDRCVDAVTQKFRESRSRSQKAK